ncbi:two-component system OmpR family sensor kinase [Oxalobacteraceae bacterium GrIS 1.11]
MDGFKRRVKDSLQIRLSLWLSLAILSVAAIAGSFAFLAAFREAHALQDDMLRQVGALFEHHHLSAPQAGDGGRAADSDPEARVFVQLLAAPPPSVPADGELALPANLLNGMQTVIAGDESYRVLVKTLAGGQRLAVAQETALRDEIARDSALRTLLPFLILLPILLLVVADLLRKIFQPIADLSLEIDRRGEQELHPIAPAPLPAEIRPFVWAINGLLERVEHAMQAQRRFVADAAHELRSPLTALSLQAERLAVTDMSSSAHERLGTLRQGIERALALLAQLLALARVQSPAIGATIPVSVQQVYRRVLEDLLPLAQAKGIDIGLVGDADAPVLADEFDLLTLVKNLLDNAIRYTPAGGRVDLSVSSGDGATTLTLEDSGPGIPERERGRVFDPFYRILGSEEQGSGLGLSIVQSIATRLGATVTLASAGASPGTGLRVTLTFH